MPDEINFNALLPQEMAQKAEELGANKSKVPLHSLFALSILVGAFIGMCAMFSTITAPGSSA